MPKFEFEFRGGQRGLDTVVFVHGLKGDVRKTWGNFPTLISTDLDLPELDILFAGYNSRFLRWDPDIKAAGDRLITELETQVLQNSKIFLVGHSLGGLVILYGIVSSHRQGHARARPCCDIAWITLFATPTMGSMIAAIYKEMVVFLRMLPISWLKLFLRVVDSKQVTGMARGGEVDQFISNLGQFVYYPSATPGSSDFMRHIDVRAVIGDDDRVVDPRSVAAIFHTPAPKSVPGTHATLKLPAGHADARYKALANDIADSLRSSFAKLCHECLAGDKIQQALFFNRWGRAIEKRMAQAFPRKPYTRKEKTAIASLVWDVGNGNLSDRPGAIMNKALITLSEFGLPP